MDALSTLEANERACVPFMDNLLSVCRECGVTNDIADYILIYFSSETEDREGFQALLNATEEEKNLIESRMNMSLMDLLTSLNLPASLSNILLNTHPSLLERVWRKDHSSWFKGCLDKLGNPSVPAYLFLLELDEDIENHVSRSFSL